MKLNRILTGILFVTAPAICIAGDSLDPITKWPVGRCDIGPNPKAFYIDTELGLEEVSADGKIGKSRHLWKLELQRQVNPDTGKFLRIYSIFRQQIREFPEPHTQWQIPAAFYSDERGNLIMDKENWEKGQLTFRITGFDVMEVSVQFNCNADTGELFIKNFLARKIEKDDGKQRKYGFPEIRIPAKSSFVVIPIQLRGYE